jgi:GNAT superfamily N-acetyltransferase
VSDLLIDVLTAGDLEAAFALSSTAGWNQLRDDWRMLLQLAPSSSFAARIDGRVIGTAIAIDYDAFGWIAMMLVDQQHRGRGIGARLLEAALDATPSHLPVRLDATPLGRPLYEKYGFREETTLTRYVRKAPFANPARVQQSAAESAGVSQNHSVVRQMTCADVDAIAGRDAEVFGGNRRPVLEWMSRKPGFCYIASAENGSTHYCLGRGGRLFDEIGPVVAGHAPGAQALVRAALGAASDRPVILDAFDAQPAFTAWLAGRGFQPERPLYRMCRGTWAFTPGDLFEFAILGPEFG